MKPDSGSRHERLIRRYSFETRKDSSAAIASGNRSVADEYSQHGVYFTPADNSQATAYERLEEAFFIDERRTHAVSGEPGAPRWYFSAACPEVVSQIEQQRKKLKRNPLSGETEYIEERAEGVPDHAYDTTVYCANYNASNSGRYRGPVGRPAMRYPEGRSENVNRWHHLRPQVNA